MRPQAEDLGDLASRLYLAAMRLAVVDGQRQQFMALPQSECGYGGGVEAAGKQDQPEPSHRSDVSCTCTGTVTLLGMNSAYWLGDSQIPTCTYPLPDGMRTQY